MASPSTSFLALNNLLSQQAIGDGGQGWGNVILYIFTSEKLRKRLFGWMTVCVHNSNQVDRLSKPSYKEQYAAINNHPTAMNNPGGVSILSSKMVARYTPKVHINGEPLSAISHEPTTEFNT